jgi:hypothetical protein
VKRALALACWAAALAAPLPAWHMPVHRMITEAAIRTLAPTFRDSWGGELDRLVAEYCTWPDIYAGSSGARAAELQPYNEVRGRTIHNVTWNRHEDLESLEFLRLSIAEARRAGNPRRAAIFAGTLAHFIEDSTCPAHALTPWDSPLDVIRDLVAPPPEKRGVLLHQAMERSSPPVDLKVRLPRFVGNAALLDGIYEGVRANRAVLLEMARAAYDGDERRMDLHRAAAARCGAELFADAFFSAAAQVSLRRPVQ